MSMDASYGVILISHFNLRFNVYYIIIGTYIHVGMYSYYST